MRDGPDIHRLLRGSTVVFLLVGCVACAETPAEPVAEPAEPETGPILYNPDWTDASHAKEDPRYDLVFPQDSVNRVDIVMTASQWSLIRSNVTDLWGFGFGTGSGSGVQTPSEDPAYADVTVTFSGRQWNNVGFRLKGHTSLLFSWWNGIQKLPFRLHFDRYENDFPGIEDQRIYGFKELSMAPSFNDPSLIRDRLAAELFRMAGVPAARTAFYRVYIDFGDGPVYSGVYTMVEVIDDTMVEDQFGEDSGNIYKPESNWRSFDERDFEKKNHKSAADYSDVRDATAALHDDLRTSDPAAWRAGLEATFDVDHFLHWLAVSNAIVNKDSYGAHPRNYYLYHHPQRGLVWIPWDHNVALNGSPGVSTGGRPSRDGLTLAMDGVDDDWPLIRYIIDDPVYRARYRTHLAAFIEGVFNQATTDALIDEFEALISPWVSGVDGELPGFTHLLSPGSYQNGMSRLREHMRDRRLVLAQFMAGSS